MTNTIDPSGLFPMALDGSKPWNIGMTRTALGLQASSSPECPSRNYTSFGCGGLAAWRAGVELTTNWDGSLWYNPRDILSLKGVTAYSTFAYALEALKALPDGGLLLAVQQDADFITKDGRVVQTDKNGVAGSDIAFGSFLNPPLGPPFGVNPNPGHQNVASLLGQRTEVARP